MVPQPPQVKSMSPGPTIPGLTRRSRTEASFGAFSTTGSRISTIFSPGTGQGPAAVKTLSNPACPRENPLERPDPASELVLRGHEDHEVRGAPLQELAAQLLEAHTDRHV